MKTQKKTKKRKTKSKSKKNKTVKFHILPGKSKKIVWSGDFLGEREVLDISKFMALKRVDTLNSIKGKYKKSISDEYKRRLKIQLKKHKPSRKRFLNKTKKKYNNKTIDKVLNKFAPNKVESVYKDLLKHEKTN